MHVKELLNDDDAVSPVIGVILMVAITVILAAVIATFVLGLGDQISSTAPQASFSFDYTEDDAAYGGSLAADEDGYLEVTHSGGSTITANELFVRGATGSTGDWDTLTDSQSTDYGANSDIKAGDSVETNVASGDTVRVTYEGADGGDSATLGKWDGPDA